MRLSRFHDQPARCMTASRHSPLISSTATLSRISAGRRNASHSDRSTRSIIGANTFHMLAFTLEKIALPSNSQPESQTCSRGNSDSRAESCRLGAPTSPRPGPVGSFSTVALALTGCKKPSAKKFVAVRAAIFSKIHWLNWLLGQNTPGVSLAASHVFRTLSVRPNELSAKPFALAASRNAPRSAAR